MPDAKGLPIIWEVWDVNQVWSRSSTNPKQPNDPKEMSRPYLIIADPFSRATATCCPLNEKTHSPMMTEVELPNGYEGFITKDCLVICHEIYTLEKKYFTNYRGILRQGEISKVEDALYEFLKI